MARVHRRLFGQTSGPGGLGCCRRDTMVPGEAGRLAEVANDIGLFTCDVRDQEAVRIAFARANRCRRPGRCVHFCPALLRRMINVGSGEAISIRDLAF